MALNCLTCQGLPRVDSETDLNPIVISDNPHYRHLRSQVGRSWSGNLVSKAPYKQQQVRNDHHSQPPPVAPGKNSKKKKGQHQRLHSSGPTCFEDGAPRLVRSCGMRRDWSFENLREIRLKN